MLEGEATRSQEDTVKSYEYPVAASRHGKQLAQLVELAQKDVQKAAKARKELSIPSRPTGGAFTDVPAKSRGGQRLGKAPNYNLHNSNFYQNNDQKKIRNFDFGQYLTTPSLLTQPQLDK